MAGLFDDLIPKQKPQPAQGGLFDDLIPPPRDTRADFMNNTGAFAEPATAPAAVDMNAPTVPAGTPDKSGQYYAQKAARIPADVIGAIPDMADMYANTGLQWADQIGRAFGGDGIDFRFPSTSDAIANVAANAYEGAGGQLVKPEEVTPATRGNAEALRFGGGALASGGILSTLARSGAIANAPNIVRRFAEPLAEPYNSGNPAKTLVGDAMGGAGAGYAGQGYEDYVPDSIKNALGPLGKVFASILGGVGANTIDAIGSGLTNAALTSGQNIIRGSRDRALPANPETGQYPRRVDVEEAARIAQKMPTDLPRAVSNIEAGAKDFGSFVAPNEMPTTGMLADDVGMATNENIARGRDAQPFVERDAAREAAAANKLNSVTPPGNGRAFTDKATALHDEALSEAERRLAASQLAQESSQHDVATQNAPLEAARANQPRASEALSDEFNAARTAARQEKNALYDQVDPKTPVENGAEFLGKRLAQIDADMPEAERMAGGAYADIANNIRGVIEKGGPITYGDLKVLHDQIATAKKAAIAASGQSVAGSGTTVQRLRQLDEVVNHLTDQVNPDAAKHYSEVYAPRFKQGKAGEYGGQIDRAARTGGESSATRPSEFGGKFLSKPEDAASLKRALTPETQNGPRALPGPGVDASAPQAGMFPQSEQNVKDWMMGDLAKSGVLTGNAQIRYDRFKQWVDKNRGTIDQFPSLRDYVDTELGNAQRGGALSRQLADDVAAASANLKQTQRELNRSALSAVIGKDPERAVGAIMGSGDPERQMGELVDRLHGDPDAIAGLKTAVRDWITQKKGDTKAIVGHGDLRHVSAKGMTDLFNQHEKTLARIYTPEEMNTLRQVHALAAAPAKLNVKSLPGSDTFSRIMAEGQQQSSKLSRVREAALKLWFGMLRGGGFNRGINLALETLPNNQAEVQRIVNSMWFDPDVAGHLLKMPVRDRDIPSWNAKLNRLLSASSGGRDQGEDE